MDTTDIWSNFYHYKSAVDDDASALDGYDFEVLLDHLEDFLRYVDSKNSEVTCVHHRL